MPGSPSVAAALVTLCASTEPFSQSAINALFKACIVAAGIEWETQRSLGVAERLWDSDRVMAAIEALQDAHEADLDTAPCRRHLLQTIDAEIRKPS